MTVQTGSVALATELTGRLEAWRAAQVRARVPGIVQQRLFTEGAQVKAGQVLFRLDTAPFQAAMASAQASQGRVEASLAQASAQLERNRPLAEARAISPQEWLAIQTAHKQAQSELAASQAAVQTARINLDYTTIRAPISGQIGRSQVSEGALVGPTEPTPLALIQQTNPLYINVTQSAAEMMQLRRAMESGQVQRPGAAGGLVRVFLEDGSEYPLPGKLLFADSAVDPATGQVSLRAELPNPQGVLLPGLFVKARLQQGSVANAVRVPQQAVTRGPAGDSVMVLGAENKPQPRSVKVGQALGGDWVVSAGLAAGDRVIVDGFQKMRPGAPVTPVPWPPAPNGAGGPGNGTSPAGAGAAASAASGAPSAAASAASR